MFAFRYWLYLFLILLKNRIGGGLIRGLIPNESENWCIYTIKEVDCFVWMWYTYINKM